MSLETPFSIEREIRLANGRVLFTLLLLLVFMGSRMTLLQSVSDFRFSLSMRVMALRSLFFSLRVGLLLEASTFCCAVNISSLVFAMANSGSSIYSKI